ncbi:hypothetical protein [Tahibacter amnicola]|uniref:Uncharacterized protein n=1 Tax=Tahibacter amnicola TaxID=2976241 RepID=A0ABY6BBW9_9GAMM|nr:hypothetical protein [Tahibacter amnicola]UXI67066.1 hypothetical protein N4264_20275 [Tahibacter amnicola]
MSQNLLSLNFTPEQLSAIDTALSTLETALADLVSLDGDERKTLARMGAKSESFCRQTLMVFEQNPQIAPPSLNVPEARADLLAFDALRPRVARLQRLTERGEDSLAALGSDVMSWALEGYAQLKVSGKNKGLEGLRSELSARFRKSARAVTEADPA